MEDKNKNYKQEVAKHLKRLQNKTNIGNTIGIIQSLSPLSITILNGQITIRQHQLYINENLSKYKIDIDIDLGEGKETKQIEIDNKLKIGDRVKMSQIGDTYTFFVDYKLQ